MKLVSWRQPVRTIPADQVTAFYDAPLSQVQAFLFETERLELPPHGGRLSIKLVLAGEEEYFIGRRTVRVRPRDALLVNAGETYGSAIRQRTRSLSIFFPDEHVAQADVPQVRFVQSSQLRRLVAGFIRIARSRNAGNADEIAYTLLGAAIAQLRARLPANPLPGVRKAATRDELIERVLRAREYIDEQDGLGCGLDRLAETAHLSKFHFLRTFRQVFGCCPAEQARARRIERATRLATSGVGLDAAARIAGYAGKRGLARAIRRQRRRQPEN